MAISGNSVFEVRTAGSDTNGGGFVTGSGGTDYSQQNSANSVGSNISTTDAHSVGTTTITSATAAFTSAITGNIVYFSGGTGWIAAQWRQATYVNATTITIDTAIATSVGMTMNIGGALATPGQAGGIVVGGNICYIQAATFAISTATTNVSGGCVSVNSGQYFIGYSTNRTLTNTDTKPIITCGSVSTATLFAGANVYNIAMDGKAQTTSRAVNGGAVVRCTFQNFTADSASAVFAYCYATTCSGSIFAGYSSVYCEATACTKTPFSGGDSQFLVNCLSYANVGSAVDGFTVPAGTLVWGCVAYGNGRDGFRFTNASNQTIPVTYNCIAESNAVSATGYGFNESGAGKAWLFNCGSYGSTAATNGSIVSFGFITNTTGSFFVNAAGTNFALNNLPSQGAAARAAGLPGAFPVASTTGYLDIGAAQHQDSPATYILSRLIQLPVVEEEQANIRRTVLISGNPHLIVPRRPVLQTADEDVVQYPRRAPVIFAPSQSIFVKRPMEFTEEVPWLGSRLSLVYAPTFTTIVNNVFVKRSQTFDEEALENPRRSSVIFSPSSPVIVKRGPQWYDDENVLEPKRSPVIFAPVTVVTSPVINRITNQYLYEET